MLEQAGPTPVSPFQSLPSAASTGEFSDASDMFGSRRGPKGMFQSVTDDYDAISMEQYNRSDVPGMDGSGFDYANLAYDDRSFSDAPAPLSLVPTSTTNPARPRTVAAGYAPNKNDPKDGKLSVVFRDGTFYNYYEVSRIEWSLFKANKSKGRFILAFLDSKPRGPADVHGQDASVRQLLYRIAKTSQMTRHPKAGTQINYQSQKPRARRF
jgi:hypothetical protein